VLAGAHVTEVIRVLVTRPSWQGNLTRCDGKSNSCCSTHWSTVLNKVECGSVDPHSPKKQPTWVASVISARSIASLSVRRWSGQTPGTLERECIRHQCVERESVCQQAHALPVREVISHVNESAYYSSYSLGMGWCCQPLACHTRTCHLRISV
jgi:hypothetical protein